MANILPVGLPLLAFIVIAAPDAAAQQRTPAYGPRINLPGSAGQYYGGHWGDRRRGGYKRGHFTNFIILEREPTVVVEREVVVREVPVAAPAPSAPPPAPRNPYVVGNSYASLPGGCMKMIEGGASYYWCSGGEWYRETAGGSAGRYKAVARP
jgi:hypothetical protein